MSKRDKDMGVLFIRFFLATIKPHNSIFLFKDTLANILKETFFVKDIDWDIHIKL